MPIHDWTRVEAGILHAFHLEWISALAHALNAELLPEEYYALPEQFASRLGPDVLTLRTNLVSYDATSLIRADVVNMAVGDNLADMPLFLDDGEAIEVPLEATYEAAYTGIPARWQRVLEASPS